MSKNKIYRDIIYFNTDKVESILAQINEGLIINTQASESAEHEGSAGAKVSKVLELLLPISGEGGYRYSRNKGLQEEKALHDFALTALLETLKLNDVTNLERKAFRVSKKRTFVKVRGDFYLYDYEDLARTIERVEIINSLLNNEEYKNSEQMENFSRFIKTAYEGLTAIEISNNKGIKFLGAINTDFLRETMRNLLFKYGGNPKGEWEMICQITNIPKNNSDGIDETLRKIEENNNPNYISSKIENEKTLSPVMNDFVKNFSQINDMFSSVSFPNISVDPIAIYKEVEL